MELNSSINIFKRLGFDSSSGMAVKLLGDVGKQSWGYLRIRSNPDKRNHCYEYEIFSKTSYLKNSGLRKGQFILGAAKNIRHITGHFWELIKHQIY